MDRSESSFDDSSARLLDPEVPSASLNPDVVHRPLTPPAQQYRDDNDGEASGQWLLNLIVVIRFLAGLFTLTNFIMQCLSYHGPTFLDFLKAVTFVIFLWNLWNFLRSLFFSKACLGKYKSRIPEVSFIVGNWKFYWCGSEDDEPDNYEIVSPKKSNQQINLALADMLLGTLLLIMGIISIPMLRTRTATAIAVFHFFVVAFEYILVILQIMSVNGISISINFHKAPRNDYQYRIRLSQDDRPKAVGKQPISVIA